MLGEAQLWQTSMAPPGSIEEMLQVPYLQASHGFTTGSLRFLSLALQHRQKLLGFMKIISRKENMTKGLPLFLKETRSFSPEMYDSKLGVLQIVSDEIGP